MTVQPWNTRTDARAAVLAITRIFNETGDLPFDLVDAYRGILAAAKKDRSGLVEEFYINLEDSCPEVLRFFPEEVLT
jgi:hypothetical protein